MSAGKRVEGAEREGEGWGRREGHSPPSSYTAAVAH